LRWGIVTNKFERFTIPVVEALGLARRAAVVVGGDTTPHAKPHPAPLLHAAQAMKVTPSACVYVGDDLRDVEAGAAAGMATIVAGYGYMGVGGHPRRWPATGRTPRAAALRDVEAGAAAGMAPIVAGYGYMGVGGDPRRWPATGWIDRPRDLIDWLPARGGSGAKAKTRRGRPPPGLGGG